jgi:hypothetical protein
MKTGAVHEVVCGLFSHFGKKGKTSSRTKRTSASPDRPWPRPTSGSGRAECRRLAVDGVERILQHPLTGEQRLV